MKANDQASKDPIDSELREATEQLPARDPVNSPDEKSQTRCSIPVTIFVVRVSGEWSADSLQWRGRVEHLPSGQSAAFSRLEEIPLFILRAGQVQEDADVPAPDTLS